MTSIKIKTPVLSITFADNESHRWKHKSGYNGISRIIHRTNKGLFSRRKNIFVDYYAGLNLEHYFNNNFHDRHEMFHPRNYPMALKRTRENFVELHQDPYAPWFINYDAVFNVTAPNCVDFCLQFTPKNVTIENSDFLGVFYASYINQPRTLGFNFLSDDKWNYFETTKHGEKSTVCGNKSCKDVSFSNRLNKHWLFTQYADILYDKPFYFGLNDKLMYLIMFDDNEKQVRFCHSPSGAGNGNPAWDFFITYPKPEKNKTYCVSGRLIIDQFQSKERIIEFWKKWQKELGKSSV